MRKSMFFSLCAGLLIVSVPFGVAGDVIPADWFYSLITITLACSFSTIVWWFADILRNCKRPKQVVWHPASPAQ